MLNFFGAAEHGEAVLVQRPGPSTRNAHGQLSPGAYGLPETVVGVIVDKPKVDEPRDGIKNTAEADYLLFFPAGTVIGKDDLVTVRGQPCTVEQQGDPLPNAFTGTVFRTEVMVRMITETAESEDPYRGLY